jgi:predicted Zn-dependent protease
MLKQFSANLRRWQRRYAYGLLSLFVAGSLILATPYPGQAQSLPWLNLLLQGVQVIQLSTLSDSQEVSLGKQMNDQLLSSSNLRLYPDRNINSYVNQVGQGLVRYSGRPNIPYVFQVVDSNQINAFATVGGYVYVTTGLLRAADNEAELASVLGHEMGHIAARHALQQMRQVALEQGLATAVGVDRNQIVNIGIELAFNRPLSRQDELEADQRGLATITKAGYAPGAMVSFMKKLLNQPSVPAFLSTHPAVSDRIRALDSEINPATAMNGIGLDRSSYRSRISRLS